jgi:hypothetical protein
MVRLFVFGLFNDVISNPAPVASDDGISEWCIGKDVNGSSNDIQKFKVFTWYLSGANK